MSDKTQVHRIFLQDQRREENPSSQTLTRLDVKWTKPTLAKLIVKRTKITLTRLVVKRTKPTLAKICCVVGQADLL